MIADAESHEFEVILVHKLNRFGRNTLEVLEYKDSLEDMGIELISVTERLKAHRKASSCSSSLPA